MPLYRVMIAFPTRLPDTSKLIEADTSFDARKVYLESCDTTVGLTDLIAARVREGEE